MSPKDAKAEAENAAQLSVALVENSIVILMLVEDHFRLQSKLYCALHSVDGSVSPLSIVSPLSSYSKSFKSTGEEYAEAVGNRKSLSGSSGGVPLDVSMHFC